MVMAGLLCLFTVGGDWSIWQREMRPRCGVSRIHWLGSVSLEHILLSFRGRYWLHCSYAGEVSAWDIILFLSSSRCVRCLSRHTILSPLRITDTPPPCQCLLFFLRSNYEPGFLNLSHFDPRLGSLSLLEAHSLLHPHHDYSQRCCVGPGYVAILQLIVYRGKRFCCCLLIQSLTV